MEKLNLIPQYPNQILDFSGDTQILKLSLYLKSGYFYADLYLEDELVIAGTPVVNNIPINAYPNDAGMAGYVFFLSDDGTITEENIGVTANLYFDLEDPRT